MQLHHYKTAIVAIWVLAVGAMGMMTGLTSVQALAVLTVVALLPPVVMLRLWHDPAQSMSESIREARR
jgi:hypothetical protein